MRIILNKNGIVNNLGRCVLNLMFNFILRWHLGFCNEAYLPTRRGFDTFYGFYAGSQDYFTHKRKPVGTEQGLVAKCSFQAELPVLSSL
jgi:hypothetical protein